MLDKITERFQPKKKTGVNPVAAGAVGAIAGAAVATYLSKSENREKIKTVLSQAKSKAKESIDMIKEKKKDEIMDIEKVHPIRDATPNKKIAI